VEVLFETNIKNSFTNIFIVLGLAAVIYIDVLQVAIMLGGSSVLLYLGLEKVGGWEELKVK
jgi:SSS family solute:Na+ symporter